MIADGRTHRMGVPKPPPPLWRRGVDALLGVRLLWKIILGNLVILTGALLIEAQLLTTDSVGFLPISVWFALVIGLSMALNAGLVILALRPVAALQETAEQVRDGAWQVRTPPSPLADPGVDRLRLVLNEMLDEVSAQRDGSRMRSRVVIQAEEREREQLSANLYSDTAQTLAGVLVQLRLLERSIERGEDPRDTSDAVVSSLRNALDSVREIARRLRPPELGDLGVQMALEAHVRAIESSLDGVPRLEMIGQLPEERLSEPSRIALYRVVQEAVANAVKYADATSLRIEFLPELKGLTTVIQDDGRGFEPELILRGGSPGLGLLAMTERARYADGCLSIDSAHGRGTRVTLRLPWRDTEACSPEEMHVDGWDLPAVAEAYPL